MVTNERVNILLVDDQPGKLIALESVLSVLGENIVKVNSGLQALEYLLKNECAVIVLDVNMPTMDGFETAALIRERPSLERTPIIFVSAYNVSDLDRLKGYDIGGVDYLFVPVVPAILKAKVQVFVEVFRQKQVIKKQADHLAEQNRRQEKQIAMIHDLNGQLQEANEELESFSYSVSHDLRGPLRSMGGFCEILVEEHGSELSPTALDYVNRVKKASARMTALVHDLLAYSRVTKGELKAEQIDLEVLMQDILEQNQSLQEPQATVIVKKPLQKVIGHEVCLGQCLSNLLINAVKFVSPGERPRVNVTTETRGTAVRIWIEDNGIGIDPSHHARIFQLFGKIHGEGTYEGTGIGLTIVKKGVERMGGKIGLDSEVGRGSKFWIELPCVVPAPTPSQRSRSMSA